MACQPGRAPGPDPLARRGDYVRGVTAPRIADVAFAELLTLEPHGPDTYVGTTARYPCGGSARSSGRR